VKETDTDLMVSLCTAIIGLVLLAVAPIRQTGLIFGLTLGITFLLTVFDMSTHRDTSTDLTGFVLTLMVGGIALFMRSERGMKD
jgi:hypothetical protein